MAEKNNGVQNFIARLRVSLSISNFVIEWNNAYEETKIVAVNIPSNFPVAPYLQQTTNKSEKAAVVKHWIIENNAYFFACLVILSFIR